ncbi:MAG: hypothetical protein SGPRY_009228 [Prymnesium sp.]
MEHFNAHRVAQAHFEADPSLLFRPELRIRIGEAILTWERGAPLLASYLAYGTPLARPPPPPPLPLPHGSPADADKAKRRTEKEKEKEKHRFSAWLFGNWSSDKHDAPPAAAASGKRTETVGEFNIEDIDIELGLPPAPDSSHQGTPLLASAGADSADGAEGFFSSDGLELTMTDGAATPERGGGLLRQRRSFVKTLRPTSEQLKAMGLRFGTNTIKFSVNSGKRQEAVIQSQIYVFKPTTKLVISDVDGTITKSDVLGHLMPRVGYDWSHKGVTSLYEAITANGYQVRDIRSLWPEAHNPFYAGFGNRASDVVAYKEAGVPPARIMVVNPQGEIHTSMREQYCWATYPRLLQLCNQMFPAINQAN